MTHTANQTTSGRCRIIAEAASNHRGDLERAKAMVWAAREAGADFLKVQSWQAKNLRRDDPDRGYFEGRELGDEGHRALIAECRRAGIGFLTSCMDRGRIPFLAGLGLEYIKVPSPDCGSLPMLRELAERFPYLIISTGMTPQAEVEATAQALAGKRFALLHCVSLYPTPAESVNLRRMEWLRALTPDVGYSDHSVGLEAVQAAIAMGAVWIEKHFDLEADPDRPFQMVPAELRQLCDYAELAATLRGTGAAEMDDHQAPARRQWVGRWGDNRS